MKSPPRFLRVASLLLLLAGTAAAQALKFPSLVDEPVFIDADEIEYRQEDSIVGAQGNVVVQHGGMRLEADEMRYSRGKRTAQASGRVHLQSPEGWLSAQSMLLNLDDETGELSKMELHAQSNRYSLWGDRAEKGMGQSYHIENGRFTTCRCAEGAPSWSITGDRFDVSVGGYADVRGGRFNVLDVPVLFVPRAIFPVQLARQSGFLMPRFGASSRRGFQTMLPFYLVIDKSQDATVALDTETSARAGLLAEYRYSLSRSSAGTVGAAYFNESFRGQTQATTQGSTIPENRWSAILDQRQGLPGDVKAHANVLLVSDDLFLREINTYSLEHQQVVATRTLPYTDSRVGVVRAWDRLAATAEATYYQNLAQAPGVTESQTLQRLPEARLWGQETLANAAILSLDTSAVAFERRRYADGFRVDLQPGIQVPLPLGPYAFGSVRATGRETGYRLLDNELSDGTELPHNRSRESFRIDAVVESSLGRVFANPLAADSKLKHVIEPVLAYTFVPNVGQGDLPLFDGVDRVNARNQFTYGASTRLLEKGASGTTSGDLAVRELGRLSLTQTVDIFRVIEPISCQVGGSTPCASNHFSDIDLAGRINPSRLLSLRFLSNYDTNNNNLSATQVGFYVEDPRAQELDEEHRRVATATSAGVAYRVLAPNRLQQLDANMVVELTDWVGFLYSSRYDIVNRHFLDNFYGIRLLSRCDCWSLDLTVTDRTNPRELEVRAQISLVGLGSSPARKRTAFVP